MRFLLSVLLICFVGLFSDSFAQGEQLKFNFSILDENGNDFAGLRQEQIKFGQNRIVSLKRVAERRLEVTVLFDISASQERMMPFQKRAAHEFISGILDPSLDRIALITFAGKMTLEHKLSNDFVSVRRAIDGLKFIPPDGFIIGTPPKLPQAASNKVDVNAYNTSVLGSVKEVLDGLSKAENGGSNRIILLISDGVDTIGDERLRNVVELSVRSQCPIFAIGIGEKAMSGVDEKKLKSLTEKSGGMLAIPKNTEELPASMRFFRQGLRAVYEVIVETRNPVAKDKPVLVEIGMVDPELRRRKMKVIVPASVFVD